VSASQENLVCLDHLSTGHLTADLKADLFAVGHHCFAGLLAAAFVSLHSGAGTAADAVRLRIGGHGHCSHRIDQALADLGLSEVTIESAKINHDQVSALFWINSAIGLALTAVTMALAPVLSWFYREPRLSDLRLSRQLIEPAAHGEAIAS
jgi:hypothetical protein